MCGFLVTVGLDGAFSHRMLGALRRRGPDGIGFWAMGPVRIAQTRLAIQGLDDRSLAPLESGHHVMAFNGEIYNFLDLARQYSIPPVSDTHVLLEAWRRFGEGCLKSLEGFWAFATYDSQAKKLHLVRDQFGIRPLYYVQLDGGLIAGSTLGAVRDAMAHAPALDTHALSDYVRYQLTFVDRTFLQGIRRVPPGHVLEYDLNSSALTIRPYEDIWAPGRYGQAVPTDEWVNDARDTLVDACLSATASDVGFATTCSGGIDSSLVTRITQPNLAFHANYADPDCNETQWAKTVVADTDTRLMVINCDEEPDLVTRLESLVEDFDDLAVGSVILPADELFGHVATREKVLLLGTGGDELFGGYVRYQLALGECPQDSYRALFESMSGLSGRERFERAHCKGDPSIYRFYDHKAARRFNEELGDHDSLPDAMLAFDRRHFLAGLLTIDDRIAGRHGLEGRPALLHQKFVRRVLELNPAHIAREPAKGILRRMAEGILPQAVIDRTDKMGFTTPCGTFVNACAHKIREQLAGSRFRDLYDLRRVNLTADTKFSREIFGLSLLDCWLRRYA